MILDPPQASVSPALGLTVALGRAISRPAPGALCMQTIWNPIFGVMFFSYLGITEGKSMGDIQKKIKNDLATAVMGSWTVWIPAHTINFAFVPTSQRLLYINTIQVKQRTLPYLAVNP